MDDDVARQRADWAEIHGMAQVPPRYAIPFVKTVRVCKCIEPEQMKSMGDDYIALQDRYGVLTRHLALRGGEGMARGPDGILHLVGRLRAAAPWMIDATAVVEEQLELALWAGKPWLKLRPLLLVGGPATGKSHFARLLAEASGCAMLQLPMGGDNDNRALSGTARGWMGTQPALPILAMAQKVMANPVVILDEIDKVSPDKRAGNAHDTLLSMLEPVTAGAWYDRCLMTAVDLRHVVWIATANAITTIPAPLLSRFDVVRVGGPGLEHAAGLLGRFRTEWCRRNGVPPAMLPDLSPLAEALLVDHFARTRSLRQLRRGHEVALREAILSVPKVLH